jgi:hypothetical protein
VANPDEKKAGSKLREAVKGEVDPLSPGVEFVGYVSKIKADASKLRLYPLLGDSSHYLEFNDSDVESFREQPDGRMSITLRGGANVRHVESEHNTEARFLRGALTARMSSVAAAFPMTQRGGGGARHHQTDQAVCNTDQGCNTHQACTHISTCRAGCGSTSDGCGTFGGCDTEVFSCAATCLNCGSTLNCKP